MAATSDDAKLMSGAEAGGAVALGVVGDSASSDVLGSHAPGGYAQVRQDPNELAPAAETVPCWRDPERRKRALVMLGIMGVVTVIVVGVVRRAQAPVGPPPPDFTKPFDVVKFVRQTMDRSADPCGNFYQYACGGWIKAQSTPTPDMPEDYESFGMVEEHNAFVVRTLLRQRALPMASDLYTSCTDERAQEAKGFSPIAPYLVPISAPQARLRDILVNASAVLNGGPFFDLGVDADADTASEYVLFLLPTVPPSARLLSESPSDYDRGVAQVLRALNVDLGGVSVDVMARTLRELEQRILALLSDALPEDLENDDQIAEWAAAHSEERTVASLFADAAGGAALFPLDDMLRAAGLASASNATRLETAFVGYFSALADLLAATPLRTLRAQVQLRLAADLVDDDIVADIQSLRGVRTAAQLSRLRLARTARIRARARVRGGRLHPLALPPASATRRRVAAAKAVAKAIAAVRAAAAHAKGAQPRRVPEAAVAAASAASAESEIEQACMELTETLLYDVFSGYFVNATWPPGTETVAAQLVTDIRASFDALLQENAWLDEASRAQAQAKLASMTTKLGYPRQQLDYSGVRIAPDDYLHNLVQLRMLRAHSVLALVGQPVDRTMWMFNVPASMVNAFYAPTDNSINLPAGLWQYSFFNVSFPASINYGAIGTVVGHEITHGFDNLGSQFDGVGRRRDTWTNESRAEFNLRSACFVEQYGEFKIGETVHLNGTVTLGENIADNGGLHTAFNALRLWAQRSNQSLATANALLPELTNQQLFFVSFAQNFCEVYNEMVEEFLVSAQFDVHSPGFARVLGSVSNSLPFANAFGCPIDAPMNPASKCTLW